ncbi:AAA family ATPase [Streptomyces goshikiensis]|uniref:AAA family ATPase n=1 Tax=Streptomyces goshikiensis TaxID=1942 RepID=UPI0036AA87ED
MRPLLVTVTGPPGSGKSTLAHALAAELGCPAILYDEVKHGLLMNAVGPLPNTEPFDMPALDAFARTLGVLLWADVTVVTVVTEADFQDILWLRALESLTDVANLRIIRCHTPAQATADRIDEPAARDRHRTAPTDQQLHTDISTIAHVTQALAEVLLDAPTLLVDTSDGYRPALSGITAYVRHR